MSGPAELWTADQAALADRHTMDVLGVPSPVLMERAALAVAREVIELRSHGSDPVVVLCGSGNNGGDGYACARILAGWGIPVAAVAVLAPASAADQRGLAQRCGVKVHATVAELAGSEASIVVDAMLGTGSRGAPRGTVVEALRWSAGAAGCKVAIDVPTGVDPSTGAVAADAFAADVTVTFGRSKPGLHVTPGRGRAGRVVVADIGLVAAEGAEPVVELVDPHVVSAWIAALPAGAHKNQRGHLGIVGGSAGTPGAAILAGTAGLRAGAGLVTLSVADPEVQAQIVAHRPELMVEREPPGGPRLPRAEALVVGPGLTAEAERAGLERLYREDPRPAVWDASALDHVTLDGSAPVAPRVLTPHPGEASRLLVRLDPSWTGARIQAERLKAAAMLASATGAIVVLKGEGSIVAAPAGRIAIATSGSPALATAGTGDVLAGLLGACLARGLGPWQAACAAVHVHGLAGELVGARGVPALALDVAEGLQAAMGQGRTGAGWPRFVRG